MKVAGLSILATLVVAGCLPKLEPPPKAAEKPLPVEAEEQGVLWQETFERPDIASLGWGSPSKSNERELETVFRIVVEGEGHFLRARHDGRPETDGPEPPHFGRVWEEDALKLSEAENDGLRDANNKLRMLLCKRTAGARDAETNANTLVQPSRKKRKVSADKYQYVRKCFTSHA